MSCLIQCVHVSKTFGPTQLLSQISLSINQGETFALIGENGAGKTTLLKILLCEVQPDSGKIVRRDHLTIGYLPQEIIVTDQNMSVKDYIEGELNYLEKEMSLSLETPERLQEWAELHERYEQLGGYKRIPLEKVLNGLKLPKTLLDQSMSSLSSGERVRVALAKILIQNPDLLLLDEPTNHLDFEMLNWFEEILQNRTGATIVISHDRKFLNATCNRLIEIQNGKLNYYGGNYDFYLSEQQRKLSDWMKAYEAQEEERQLIKQKIKSMTFSKGKPALPTDRNIMAYDRRGGHYQKSVQRNLDVLKGRLEEIESNLIPHPKPKSIKGIRFTPTTLSSAVAIELDHISKAFGKRTLFSNLSKVLRQGDRIILTGSNGSGKTTLLMCIAGYIPIDSGQIRYAPSAKIAYLDQEIEMLPMNMVARDYFANRFQLSEEQLRRELHKAALGEAELLDQPFSKLSTGQRKRLMILSLVLENPNVLLLDEPTNHLDLLTLEALEKALLEFKGAILAVSHDETFIEKIATEIWRL